jgi:hypothetical protein
MCNFLLLVGLVYTGARRADPEQRARVERWEMEKIRGAGGGVDDGGFSDA